MQTWRECLGLHRPDRQRVRLPNARPRSKLADEEHTGVVTLAPVAPEEPSPAEVRFEKRGGRTVAFTDPPICLSAIKADGIIRTWTGKLVGRAVATKLQQRGHFMAGPDSRPRSVRVETLDKGARQLACLWTDCVRSRCLLVAS